MPAKLPYCVYVLRSEKDHNLYIGFTTNLKERLTNHFHGEVASTATRRPLTLLYCEYHASETDAMRREGYFKTTAGQIALKLMLREALLGRQVPDDPSTAGRTTTRLSPSFASPKAMPALASPGGRGAQVAPPSSMC
jgi:putative endonuclease